MLQISPVNKSILFCSKCSLHGHSLPFGASCWLCSRLWSPWAGLWAVELFWPLKNKIMDFIYLIFGCNDLSSEMRGLLQTCSVDRGDDFKRWLKRQIWYNSQIDQGLVFKYCSVPRLMLLFNPSARAGGLLRKQDETLLCLWLWVLPRLQDAVKRIASVLLGGCWVSFARRECVPRRNKGFICSSKWSALYLKISAFGEARM